LKNINNGVLGDIAPTILELMGIENPLWWLSILYFKTI
jgi:bisphosphoglycerate-independent phosphoglycerate mutase (AlkP superfamily)